MSAPGRVALVGAGPGDRGLVTVRGLALIRAADVIIHDRLVNPALLDEAPTAERIDVGKRAGAHTVSQAEIHAMLVHHARRGRLVVRLKGGDPYVFGRGGEEAIACAEAGVPVTVIPGVSSSIAAPAVAGIPVTHRGVAHEFTVVSGHVAPDDPTSLVDWPALARMRGTLVVLMGLKNLPAIAATLLAHGRSPDTPTAVVQEGTTASQRTVRTTLGAVTEAASSFRPPAIVVVGEVVGILP